jgi:hypothetical protein
MNLRRHLGNALRLHAHRKRTLLRLSSYLHERTGGMIGSLSHLIREAAIDAIANQTENQPGQPRHRRPRPDRRTAPHHYQAPAANHQSRPGRMMRLRVLPISLPPISRETIGSYLHRLADANHITSSAVTQLLGISRRYSRGDDDPTGWTPQSLTPSPSSPAGPAPP